MSDYNVCGNTGVYIAGRCYPPCLSGYWSPTGTPVCTTLCPPLMVDAGDYCLKTQPGVPCPPHMRDVGNACEKNSYTRFPLLGAPSM